MKGPPTDHQTCDECLGNQRPLGQTSSLPAAHTESPTRWARLLLVGSTDSIFSPSVVRLGQAGRRVADTKMFRSYLFSLKPTALHQIYTVHLITKTSRLA